jgi:hypothetical protein
LPASLTDRLAKCSEDTEPSAWRRGLEARAWAARDIGASTW